MLTADNYVLETKNSSQRRLHGAAIVKVVRMIEATGAKVRIEPDNELLIVDERLRISILMAGYCNGKDDPKDRWLRFERHLDPDFTLFVRMASDGVNVGYYLLIPRHMFARYRSDDLRTLLPTLKA